MPKVASKRMAIAFLDISRGMVGRLTAKREVLGWIPGAEPILRELPFVLETARPSRGSDSHMRKHGGRFSTKGIIKNYS